MGNECCGGFEVTNFELSSMQNRNWMEKYYPCIKSTLLINQIIPGSHDSASSSIPDTQFFSPVFITQKLSIFDQLCLGARYIDIRYGTGGTDESSNVKVMHQVFKGKYLEEIFNEINQFLFYNPKEFIIMNLQQERPVIQSQIDFIIQKIDELFSEKLVKQEDIDDWFQLDKVVMDDIFKHKKNLFILTCDKFPTSPENDPFKYEKMGIINKNPFVVNNWHNVDEIEVLLKKIDSEIDHYQTIRKKELFIHQIIQNAQFHAAKKMVCCCVVPRLDRFNKRLAAANEVDQENIEGNLSLYMQRNINKRWNCVMLDFLGMHQDLINFLVKSNSSITLKVKGAFLTKVDVTDMIRAQITRKNCQYIPYPMLFFAELFKYFRKKPDKQVFIIKYNFDDGPTITHKFLLNKAIVIGFDADINERAQRVKKEVSLRQFDDTWSYKNSNKCTQISKEYSGQNVGGARGQNPDSPLIGSQGQLELNKNSKSMQSHKIMNDNLLTETKQSRKPYSEEIGRYKWGDDEIFIEGESIEITDEIIYVNSEVLPLPKSLPKVLEEIKEEKSVKYSTSSDSSGIEENNFSDKDIICDKKNLNHVKNKQPLRIDIKTSSKKKRVSYEKLNKSLELEYKQIKRKSKGIDELEKNYLKKLEKLEVENKWLDKLHLDKLHLEEHTEKFKKKLKEIFPDDKFDFNFKVNWEFGSINPFKARSVASLNENTYEPGGMNHLSPMFPKVEPFVYKNENSGKKPRPIPLNFLFESKHCVDQFSNANSKDDECILRSNIDSKIFGGKGAKFSLAPNLNRVDSEANTPDHKQIYNSQISNDPCFSPNLVNRYRESIRLVDTNHKFDLTDLHQYDRDDSL